MSSRKFTRKNWASHKNSPLSRPNILRKMFIKIAWELSENFNIQSWREGLELETG